MDTLTPTQIAGRLTAALATIRDLWDDMLEPTGPATGGGHGDPRIITLTNLRLEVLWQVRSWAQLVAEECDTPAHETPDGNDMHGLCQFLAEHTHDLAAHPAAHDAVQELQDCVIAIENAVYGTQRSRLLIGTCTHTNCDGDVREAGRNEHGELMARCQTCTTRATVEWWAASMGLTIDRTLTTDEVCALAKKQFGRCIKPPTVWRAVKNGRLNPIDPKQKPHEFKLVDVVGYLST